MNRAEQDKGSLKDASVYFSPARAMRRLLAGEPPENVFDGPIPPIDRWVLSSMGNSGVAKEVSRVLLAAIAYDAAEILEQAQLVSPPVLSSPDIRIGQRMLTRLRIRGVYDKACRDGEDAIEEVGLENRNASFVKVVDVLSGYIRGDRDDIVKVAHFKVRTGVGTALFHLQKYHPLLIRMFAQTLHRNPTFSEFAALAENSFSVVSRSGTMDAHYIQATITVLASSVIGTADDYQFQRQRGRVSLLPEVREQIDAEYVRRLAHDHYSDVITGCPANDNLLLAIHRRSLAYMYHGGIPGEGVDTSHDRIVFTS